MNVLNTPLRGPNHGDRLEELLLALVRETHV